MITTSELTAHLEGTFEGRLEVAKRIVQYDPSRENQIRLEEAQRAYDTVFGVIYEFNEANTGR